MTKKLAGVIGFPIAHSLSPRIHNYWIKQHNIADAEYVKREVRPDNLEAYIEKMRQEGFVGFNVTVPHKEAVMPLMDELKGAAQAVGAVNTVLLTGAQSVGMNTDVFGFVENLKDAGGLARFNRHALVLGAGGAARAVIMGLQRKGGGRITLTNRTRERAEELQKTFGGAIEVVDWDKKEGVLADVSLLVNTTSLGMKGQPALELSLDKLPTDALVTDIVYNPLETPLLKAARERGNVTVDGLGMLLYQAQAAFKMFFGVEPFVTEDLRKHVLEAL